MNPLSLINLTFYPIYLFLHLLLGGEREDRREQIKCMSNPTQDELKTFVDNNVIYNQTMLVEALLKENKLYEFDMITNLEDEDGECQEIFEWWIVNDWLLEKLKEKGEPILETDYENYWGRTCTGQAIYLDSVISDIYTDNKIF